MPTFIITLADKVLKVNSLTGIEWVTDARKANSYTSKYQAKRHLKQLDNVPDCVKIVEVQTVEEI